MATIILSDITFYAAGKSGASAAVGLESNRTRVVRYSMVSPAAGASAVSVSFTGNNYGDGDYPELRCYIGTDPDSHANPSSEYDYTCELQRSGANYAGTAEVVLLPNTTYYVWVFPAASPDEFYGWLHWSRTSGRATVDASGAAQSEISGSDGTLGEVNTLVLTRYSAALTHVITAACGDESMTIATGVQEDTVDWTPPVSWASQNTAGTTVSVTVTCSTYSGSTMVGKSVATLAFDMPADIQPSVNLAVTDKLAYLDTYGYYIQGKSKAAVSAVAEGSYGSIIQSYSATCGSLSGIGANLVFDLPDAGEISIEVKVIDSRGRSATASVHIDVQAYNPPSASIISQPYRCDSEGNEDEEGTYAAVIFDAVVTALDGQNSASYQLQYRVRGDDAWTSIALEEIAGEYTPSNVVQIFPADPSVGYDVCLIVSDNFGSVQSPYRTVQVSFKLFDADRVTKALGFGRRATVSGVAAFGLPVMLDAGWVSDGMYEGISDQDETDLNTWLDAQLAGMKLQSIKFVGIYCEAVTENVLHGFLCCHNENEATVLLWSVSKTLYWKAKVSGAWGETSAHTM